MEFKVIEEKENPFYERKDIVLEAENVQTTPSRGQVEEFLSKKLGCSEDQVIVHKMDQKFGSKKVVVTARVYSSAEKLLEVEPQWRLERGANESEKKEEAPAAEAPKAEKPKEKKDAPAEAKADAPSEKAEEKAEAKEEKPAEEKKE